MLGYPPWVFTDIPTNPIHRYDKTGADESYAPQLYNQGFLNSIAQIPWGFTDERFRGGVIAGLNTVAHVPEPQGWAGTDYGRLMRVYGHPLAGRAEDLSKNWTRQATADLNFGEDPIYGPTAGDTLLAAQRKGEYCYCFWKFSHYSSDGGGVFRFNDMTSQEQVYGRSYYLGGAIVGSYSALWSGGVFSANASAHVADWDLPFVWLVDGANVTAFPDNGADLGTKFWTYQGSDDTGISSSTTAYDGRWIDWYQEYSYPSVPGFDQARWGNPAGSGLGPTLVHPWRCGDYGPPEMWWLVPESGNLVFYRSRWLPGQNRPWDRSGSLYGKPYTVTFRSGGENPTGLAFEHDWFKSENRLGKLNAPFPMYNTTLQEGRYYGTVAAFSVVRDMSRANVLHLVLGLIKNDWYSYGAATQYWTATSGDDGKTWTRLRAMYRQPGVPDFTNYDPQRGPEAYSITSVNRVQTVRQPNYGLLAGSYQHTQYRPTQRTDGQRASLALPDYQGVGSGRSTGKSAVFKRIRS